MSADVQTIIEMHKYMRPAGGPTDAVFIERYLKPLGFRSDNFGNQHLEVGGDRRIMFSSHTDTVHKQDSMQKLKYKDGILRPRSQNCLGADDTAGIWLMTEMVKAGVPGLYVIHFGEERGCLGSRELANSENYFEGVEIAIAFDRAGYRDVITHQMGMRTASDAFAEELVALLPFPAPCVWRWSRVPVLRCVRPARSPGVRRRFLLPYRNCAPRVPSR